MNMASAAEPHFSVGVEDVNVCQFHLWYPQLRKHSIKSIVIELPDDFVEYLKEVRSAFVPLLSLCAVCCKHRFESCFFPATSRMEWSYHHICLLHRCA